MSHVIDELTHPVIDDDGVYVIDPGTREITYERGADEDPFSEQVIIKGDYNSERLTFKIPKVIEGHDMSTCDIIRVHYIVTDSASAASDKAFCDIPATARFVTGNDHLTFTWLVDKRVTQFSGPVSFAIQFACSEQTTQRIEIVDENGAPVLDENNEKTYEEKPVVTYYYSWSTKPYSGLSVSDTIVATDKQAADDFVSKYDTVVQEWYNDLANEIAVTRTAVSETIAKAKADLAKAITDSNNSNIKEIRTDTSLEDGGTNTVTIEFNDPDREPTVFGIQNGSTGPAGKSAFEIANEFGSKKYDNESDWVDDLINDRTGYVRGRTLTQAEYDALSEDEKNQSDFVYIIKDAKVHADTADTADHASTADSASFAREYSAGGGIDIALQSKAPSDHSHDEITYHEERITDTEDTLDKIVYGSAEAIDIIGNGSVSIDYRTIVLGINKPEGTYYEISGTPSKTITAPGKFVFTSVEITSCSIDNTYSTHSAVISEDGKTITFSIDGEVPTHTGSTQTATIKYSYTRRAEDIDSVYHAQTATVTDNLALKKSTTYTVTADGDTSVEVTPGRAYLISAILNSGTTLAYAATIYISPKTYTVEVEDVDPDTLETQTTTVEVAVSSRSTILNKDDQFVTVSKHLDGKWYAAVAKSSGEHFAGTLTFIEL